MAVETGQREQEMAFIKHVCFYWRYWFNKDTSVVFVCTKLRNWSSVLSSTGSYASFKLLRVISSFSIATWDVTNVLTAFLGFAFITHRFVSLKWYCCLGRRTCVEQGEFWRQRSVLCVTSSGWLYSEHACETLQDDREKIVLFIESILCLRVHGNKGRVMQRPAKTKALPSLCWRGILHAWEALVLKAKVRRIQNS